MKTTAYSKISAGIVGGVLLALLVGCETGNTRVGGYVQTTAYSDPVFGNSDDYVYYPGYETYYGRRTHRYYYRDGSSWVGRSEPYNVSTNVLLTAPSVSVDFHDSPARHHDEVTRRYPRHWQNDNRDHRNDQRDNRRDDHRDDHHDDNNRR